MIRVHAALDHPQVPAFADSAELVCLPASSSGCIAFPMASRNDSARSRSTKYLLNPDGGADAMCFYCMIDLAADVERVGTTLEIRAVPARVLTVVR